VFIPAAPATPAPARNAAPPAPPPRVAAPAAPAPKRAPPRELDAIFEEADAAIELEEVVAIGTDPLRSSPQETVALLGDTSAIDEAFEKAGEPDATMALFADDDFEDGRAIPLRSNEDSSGDLDDLFADLVKE
jgi:hypothetical protein